MKTIHRLLLNDLVQQWKQGAAITALLACGVATIVMMTSAMRSVEQSRSDYYKEFRFADVFLQLTRAPKSIGSRIAKVPGVARVQTRIVQFAILDIPSMSEPVTCRILSIEEDVAHELNGVYLRRGRFPTMASRTEVVINELFADSHGFQLGDKIDVILGGKKQRLIIVGIGMSPEYVYAVQPGLIAPDNRRFGIVWMPRKPMAAAYNMEGAFNAASIQLQPNASLEDVIYQVDRIAEPYGGRGAFSAKDQDSNARVSDEMHQMRGMAYVTPSIFLLVAAFLFNIVLSRMVNQQQEQIATLRAFGYRSWEIGRHYLMFLLVFVLLGTLLGCLVGIPLSWWMINLYAKFFRFPHVRFLFATQEAGLAVLLALIAAVLGAWSAVRKAMRLAPAVAMRPESPSPFKFSFVHAIGLHRLLSPLANLIFNRLEANPKATILSILGVAFGTAIVVLGSFMEDTIDYVIDLEFQVAQRQDVTLTFRENLSPNAIHDVRHLPGVICVEPFRSVAVRLKHGAFQHRLGLMAVEENPVMFRILDNDHNQVQMPPLRGLTISQKLAEILHVQAGDSVELEVLEDRRRTLSIQVARVFPDYTSPGAYMNRGVLHRFLQESDRLSGAFVRVDSSKLPDLFRELKEVPNIASVLDNRAALNNFRALVAESTQIMRVVNAIFASIIAFGVIFNGAIISLAERGRDLATLRVMGYTRREVAFVLLGELALIAVAALPIGLPMGLGFAKISTMALDTESHRFPLIVSRGTLAYASIVILLTTALSAWFVRRLLDRLDLIAVLKVKE